MRGVNLGAGISRVSEATSLRFAVAVVMLALSVVILSCPGGPDGGDTGRTDVHARDAIDMDVKTSDLGGVDIVSEDLSQTDVDPRDVSDTPGDVHETSVAEVDSDSSDGVERDVPAIDVSGDADALVDTTDALALGCHPGDGTAPVVDCDHTRQVGSISHAICTVVPEGDCHTFWMGAVRNAMYQVPPPNEVPRHKVHLTSYKMSRFPVTVGEYRECVQAGACQSLEGVQCLSEDLSTGIKPGINNYSKLEMLSHPIVCVSYSDAHAFCEWLGGEIPTEARFEYAGSGPMTDAEQIVMFSWGQDLSHDGRPSDSDVCHVNIKPGKDSIDGRNIPDPFELT